MIPFVLLVWDHAGTTHWAIWVGLASGPLISFVLMAIGFVWLVGFGLLRWLLRPVFSLFRSQGVLKRSRRTFERFHAPKDELAREQRRTEDADDDVSLVTQVTLRSYHALNLVHVPLIVAFWTT